MAGRESIAMFLGAGASKAFKAPLTGEILPIIMKRVRREKLFGATEKKRRATLMKQLRELMPGIEAVNPKHVLITEILSLIDYMLLSAFVPAPMARAEKLQTCRVLLERAILEVLTGIVDRTDEEVIPPKLKILADWMYETGNASRFALISTNYDEILESELYKVFIREGEQKEDNDGVDKRYPFDHVNRRVNFGISWRDSPRNMIFNPPPGYRHSVLKLHGSVDWVKCELCGWIVCDDSYFFQKQAYHLVSFEKQNAHNTCNCGHWPLRPVMIAPSLVRDIRDINLLSVWKSAFEELRTADRWYMVGYSLPIDDYAIRSMLIRALKSRKTLPKIHVYQRPGAPEPRHAT